MNIMLLKAYWHAISNRHIVEEMDKLQAVRVRLMNQYAFLISLIFVIDAFRNLCLGRHLNFLILLVVGCVLFLLSWYTRVYFSTKIAASTLVGATLMVFYFCSTAGFHNGIAPYYFAILFAALFIFNEKNSLYNIFVFLWVFVLFYIVQLFDLEWFDGVEESQVYIVDGVTMGVVADAAIMDRISDLTLFIIRAGKMDRRQLPDIERIYTEKKVNNLAVVLNGIKPGGSGYGSYGYGGYGYGYGYGEEKKGLRGLFKKN